MLRFCAIIGQHPTLFKFGYKESHPLCKRIKRAMLDVFMKLYGKGVHTFYVGGALGVDMWAGELLSGLKKEPGYRELEFIIVMPFQGYSDKWEGRDKKRLSSLLASCSEPLVTGNTPRPDTAEITAAPRNGI